MIMTTCKAEPYTIRKEVRITDGVQQTGGDNLN